MSSPKRRKYSFQSDKFTHLPPAPKADREIERRFSHDDAFDLDNDTTLPCNTLGPCPPPSSLEKLESRSSVLSEDFIVFRTSHCAAPRLSLATNGGGDSSTGQVCRICLQSQDEEDDRLFKPCDCKGTIGVLHRSCLRKWVALSGKYYCEVCGYHFITEERMPSVMQWLQAILLKRLLKDLCVTAILCVYVTLGVIYCVNRIQAESTPLGCPNGTGGITVSQDSSLNSSVSYIALVVLQLVVLLVWLCSISYMSGRSFRKYRQVKRRRTIRQPTSIKYGVVLGGGPGAATTEMGSLKKHKFTGKDHPHSLAALQHSYSSVQTENEKSGFNEECDANLSPAQLSIIAEQMECSGVDASINCV